MADDIEPTDVEPTIDETLQAEADAVLAEVDQAIDAAAPADQVEDNENDFDVAEVLAQFLGVTFNLLVAPRAGDHWQMPENECQALGRAYGAVVDKYWPDLDFGVELAAVLVTVTVVGPRVAIDRRLRAEKAAAENGDSGDQEHNDD